LLQPVRQKLYGRRHPRWAFTLAPRSTHSPGMACRDMPWACGSNSRAVLLFVPYCCGRKTRDAFGALAALGVGPEPRRAEHKSGPKSTCCRQEARHVETDAMPAIEAEPAVSWFGCPPPFSVARRSSFAAHIRSAPILNSNKALPISHPTTRQKLAKM
jgi:hypothetical protein